MNRKSLPPISSMNPTTMVNLNRMTLLMSISEITPQLFISGQMAATLEQVQKLGITYILNVAVESSPIVYPKNIKLEKYDIIDFPTAPICNYFNSLTDKIHAHLTANNQNKVLVHCMAGISRSTTIVCAYLVRYMDMSLRDAYLACKKNRPICFPNLGFWNQLIAYESQLRKENSVKMVPTQFGNVPDVALEELKQLRAQQQQQTGTITLPPPTFAVTNNNPVNSIIASSEASIRPSARDLTIAHANSLVRSRSLATNSIARPSAAASATHPSNPAQQTPLFATNKQTFLTPARFGVSRLLTGGIPNNNSTTANNNSNATGPSSSSTSYASTRSLPVTTSPNIKNRHTNNLSNHSHHAPTVTINSPATTNNDQQRHTYETTYRASFIKPLAP